MAWRPEHDQRDEDDDADPEDPDASDMDEDDDPERVPCPYCRKPISEEAEVCPECGSFLSIEDMPRERSQWWKVLIVALLVALFSGMLAVWFRMG